MKNILITGITGQDGLFLTAKILKNNKSCNIVGISRKKDHSIFYRKINSIYKMDNDRIQIHNLDLLNSEHVSSFISKFKPEQIFNLSGPSSVYQSINDPTISKNIEIIFENLISSLIKLNYFPNFFQASSSEMFSADVKKKLNEESLMIPNSPYAESKYSNHKKIIKIIDNYDWNIISGIMFNHESEFRGDDYLLSKIINYVKNSKIHNKQKLELGSLDYKRDWTYAKEVMDACYFLVNEGSRGSFVIGSGKSSSIKDMVQIVFNHFDLDWKEYVSINSNLLRKGDPITKVSNPRKINKELGWKTNINFEDMVKLCIENRENF